MIKIIQTGKILEVYQYEQSPVIRFIRKKRPFGRKSYRRAKRNLQRSASVFRRLVNANLLGDNPCLVTYTMRDVVDIAVAYDFFTKFNVRLRKIFGSGIKYIAVPEFQKRGAVHFHSLIWGLPLDIVASEFRTRFIANLWGLGFVDVRLTDGSSRLASYLVKYMMKAWTDNRLLGKKLFTSSRNCNRSRSISSFKMPIAVDMMLEDYNISLSTGGGIVPDQIKRYNTVWLGRAIYKKFVMK